MKKSVLISVGIGVAGFVTGTFVKKEGKGKANESSNDKFKKFFSVLDLWMKLRDNGGTVVNYFQNRGYKRIAVYGIAHLASHLTAELKGSEIEVVYGIDRRADFLYAAFPIYRLEDVWEPVDVIVVTPVYDYKNIKKELEQKGNYNVISLEEVIRESDLSSFKKDTIMKL